jgi:hypothetical protein
MLLQASKYHGWHHVRPLRFRRAFRGPTGNDGLERAMRQRHRLLGISQAALEGTFPLVMRNLWQVSACCMSRCSGALSTAHADTPRVKQRREAGQQLGRTRARERAGRTGKAGRSMPG